MRGKRPKERKSYVLRMVDGTIVEVTREVYLEWYQSRRRERYQHEKNQKYGVSSLESLEENGVFPVGLTDSLEEIVLKKYVWKSYGRWCRNYRRRMPIFYIFCSLRK